MTRIRRHPTQGRARAWIYCIDAVRASMSIKRRWSWGAPAPRWETRWSHAVAGRAQLAPVQGLRADPAGAKNAAQAEQNAGALGWRLDAEDVAALDRVAKPGLRRFAHVLWQHG
jgi:hypothetical protein